MDISSIFDKAHGLGSVASAKAQLDWSSADNAKAGILQKVTVCHTTKMLLETSDVSELRHPGTQSW